MNFCLNISKEIIELLSNKKVTFDQLVTLKLLQDNQFYLLDTLILDGQYRHDVLLGLITKGMLKIQTDGSYTLTQHAREFLAIFNFISEDDSGFQPKSTEEIREDRMVQQAPVVMDSPPEFTDFDAQFNELWNVFPLTDRWDMNGTYSGQYYNVTHPHTRTLRNGKSKCKDKYRVILRDKQCELTHEQVMAALRYEIWFRKKNSTERKNEIQYMQNMYTWLNQRTFESYYILYQEHITKYGSIDFSNFNDSSNRATGSFSKRLT